MGNPEPASPRSGGSRPTSRTTPETVGSILEKLPPLSPTTGRPATAPTRSSATGTQLSALGAGERLPTAVAPWVLAVWQPFGLPEATIRSLSISLASHIRIVNQGRATTGSDGQHDATMLGGFQIDTRDYDRREMRKDLFLVSAALEFSPAAEIAKHVARLMARTKLRQQGDGEGKLLADTLVRDLREYPIDVVAWACDQWPKLGHVFFPAWAELRALCERRVDARKRLKVALEYYLAQPATP